MEQQGQRQAVQQNPQVKQTQTDGKVGFPEQKKQGKRFPRWLPIVLIVSVVIVVVAGAWYVLQTPPEAEPESQQSLDLVAGDSTTSEPTITPTPTPQEVNRSDVSIEVLNGTGIPKEAGFLQSEFQKLGYGDIDVGNASNQDNEETTVTFSSSLADSVKDEILDRLKELYQEVNDQTSSSADYDVSVVTGLRKGAKLPTATPTAAEEDEEATESSTPTPTGAETPTPTDTE